MSELTRAIKDRDIDKIFCQSKKQSSFALIFSTKRSKIFPLLEACKYGPVENISLLVRAGANVNRHDKYGNFPLIEACSRPDIEDISMLINAGANINQLSHGKYPLYVACETGSPKTILSLIAAKANVNRITKDSRDSPLLLACERNLTDVILALIKADSKYCFYQTDNITLQKTFSFNYPEYPIRHKFGFNSEDN